MITVTSLQIEIPGRLPRIKIMNTNLTILLRIGNWSTVEFSIQMRKEKELNQVGKQNIQ
jgi:hypothetical protein